jgi:hypothetical protein
MTVSDVCQSFRTPFDIPFKAGERAWFTSEQTHSSTFLKRKRSKSAMFNGEQPSRPQFHEIERSPLLLKAKYFAQILKEDNQKLTSFLDQGGDPSLISIETLDENEPVHIEMNVVKGPFEVGVVEHPVMDPDQTEFPSDGWRKADAEPTVK